MRMFSSRRFTIIAIYSSLSAHVGGGGGLYSNTRDYFLLINEFFYLGENVDLLFIRTAGLAFDQAILREYEDIQNIGSRKKQQIGNTVISKIISHTRGAGLPWGCRG